MKSFTYEELRAHIQSELATKTNVLKCRPRCQKSDIVVHFIKLDDDICYEPHWRGGPLSFQKGDYLRADPDDFYGLTAKTFTDCYIVETQTS